jgi:3'(2'), 5'-bisphosphate nucleotidase
MRAGIQIVEKTGPYDRVTTADVELSKLIVSGLHERFAVDEIVSEEDKIHPAAPQKQRVWLIDPIDGTDNYIANDGQYSVMVGLVIEYRPVFGWVFAPATSTLYFGGPGYGAWRKSKTGALSQFSPLEPLHLNDPARLMLGFRDRKRHPWIKEHPQVTLVKTGSIGLKVVKVLEGQADLFLYLSGKLKTWDTAGPVAIALGGMLEVGAMEVDHFSFPQNGVVHQSTIIIGRPGSIEWCRSHLGNMIPQK